MTDEEITSLAASLGWRREGSLWRDPKDGKRWAWTLQHLIQEIQLRQKQPSP